MKHSNLYPDHESFLDRLVNNFKTVLSRFAQFDGRARRREFWLFVLATSLISAIASIWDGILFNGRETFEGFFEVFFFIPTLAVSVRRLHDTGRSGWWNLLFVTFIGIPVLIYFLATEGDRSDNEYGEDPKAGVNFHDSVIDDLV